MHRRQPRLALALGPGGTRGFAHLGAIKVLLEADLHIDALCGASAGAVFGALYAMEGTREAAIRGLSVSPRELWWFFRDRLRLAPSNPLDARLREHFRDVRLEALAVPLAILAVDLHSGEEVVLREGRLSDAVEASIAIPLLARPVHLNGRYLIDGGYGRSGPAKTAREMGGEVVVGISLGEVNFCPPRLRGIAHQIARGLHRPTEAGPPGQRAVLRRVILAMAQGCYVPSDADLVIVPRVDDINPHSPFAAAAAFHPGEVAAHRALPVLRRLLSRGTELSGQSLVVEPTGSTKRPF